MFESLSANIYEMVFGKTLLDITRFYCMFLG